MKAVRPTLLVGGGAVQYVWTINAPYAGEASTHINTLADIARSVVALGWGIDMAVGHAALVSDNQVDALPGERWLPAASASGAVLRVPMQGTLDALVHRHDRFLNRIGAEGFVAPPPLTKYATVVYRRVTDPAFRPVATFSLRKLDDSGYRAFNTPRKALTVAGMVRHAARTSATITGRPDKWIDTFVLGHGEARGNTEHATVGARRFAYLPVPSIEARGEGRARVVGSVRRVILSSFADDCEAEIAWARRTLSGQELIDEANGQPIALLSTIPSNESVIRHYTREAASWATVTPVVLPGYDDPAHYRRRLRQGVGAEEQKKLLARLSDRIDALLRKAIIQAGFTRALADCAELEWRSTGYWPGTNQASEYGIPDHLKRFPRFHIKLHWRDAQGKALPVPGPICIGGGRFSGVGLFAAL